MSATISRDLQSLSINVIRGLAIDGVERAKSGHPGMPMGCAPMAYTLWQRHLKHNPKNPKWIDRDRFILSAGHGSMLLYSLLHLTGYDLTLDDLKAFRSYESRTPGHPENTHTPGVEMATGPLGQGISTAVGMALAESYLAARYNQPGHTVIDHFTYVLCSDGDLMEGVAQEACSLAGHLKLGKLICLYDDNEITIDGRTELSFTEDTAAKFEALGWQVLKVDGLDPEAVHQAIETAKADAGRPSLIAARTVIGFGSPNKAGSEKSHGAPLGPEEAKLSKEALGLPADETFWIPDDVRAHLGGAVECGAAAERAWQERWNAYAAAFPELAQELQASLAGAPVPAFLGDLPAFGESVSSRAANGTVLQAVASAFPNFIGGCADLTHSVMTEIKGGGVYGPSNRAGRNVNYGVREHAMAAMVNGITLHGGTRGMGGTFFIFSDYCRPSLRLAALMHCPSVFCFSHDSIGLGEDGPTHQPIEQFAACRAIPNFNLFRPCDAHETAVAWNVAMRSTSTPTAIVTSRQNLPTVSPVPSEDHPAHKGGYVLRDPQGGVAPRVALVATGSEVGLALHAADLLEAEGIPTRVVSLPSWFLFEQMPVAYRREVLPKDLPAVSIEAGATLGWARYAQAHVGLDRFGVSAPAHVAFEKLGFTPIHVAAVAKHLLHGDLD